MMSEPDAHGRDRRNVRRALLALLALLVVVPIATAAGYVAHLDRTASKNITRERLLPDPDGQSGAPGQAAPGAAGQETEQENGTDATGTRGKQKGAASGTRPVTDSRGQDYLVIGSDARPGDSASRSDVIVLVHVPADRSRAYLIHVPRDLYVDIPGHGKDKINAAYAYGGAPLLVSTLQQLYGVRVDHVAKTDFEGFKAMTDAVGGVDVEVEEASPGFAPGPMHMTGSQALTFVRERHGLSQGDISRGRRQQAFLRAMLVRAVSPGVVLNPARFSALVDATTAHLVVDESLTTSKIRSEALRMRSIRGSDVVFLTSPYTGFGTSPGGASIVVVDEEATADLGRALVTDQMSPYGG